MRYVSVKNFERFQHYKDRSPPWIKLYTALLSNYEFLALPEVAQAQLMKLWLVASQHDNLIPHDLAYIGRLIHTKTVHLAPLIAAGFVAIVERDASKVASESDSNALTDRLNGTSTPRAVRQQPVIPRARPRPRGEAEGETEGETETDKTTAASPAYTRVRNEMAPLIGGFRDLDHFTGSLPDELTVEKYCAEIGAALEGMHGPAIAPVDVQFAMRDWVANKAAPNLRHWRAYLRGAVPLASRSPPNGKVPFRRYNAGEEGYANARIAAGLPPVPEDSP